MIDPALFDVLHVPFVSGHNLERSDLPSKHMVAIVNQTLAKRYFPNQNPVGQKLQVHTLAFLPEPPPQNWVTIAGVVRDFKNDGVLQPVMPEVFLPYTISALGGFSVLLRTTGNPGPVIRAIDSAALKLDGTAVVRHVRTMTESLDANVYAKPRFGLQIFSVFTFTGLALVGAGLFSVTAYVISQRRRELGIRLALGASTGQMQRMIILGEMRTVAIGLACGLTVTVLISHLLQAQLWAVNPRDPGILAVVASILIATGLLACYFPARTILRVDPAETLRAE